MSSYRYRVTVEKLSDANGEAVHGQSLSFYATNHDDILAIVERLQTKLPFESGTVAALGVGLRLFSEVALMRGNDPLFAQVRPALRDFIQQLKIAPERPPAGAQTS
ncbi:DUF3861 domain-containing protein [Edaphobacter sp. 12200R-103]|jgi:hypothetical protein|uniref:DUF3861 domain-containing protein n=1 Tax=Edaphobacter sp. 12200R-103 TaxID=2703788 RepID=UPI00138B856B|nr:DUF3861 domain-containing protein [Edaphobacter sp. 12200R-103]QHS50354.1 DUF3861 domain-containing protein [Edaphobacter sp. 12200R-103]